MIGTHLASLEGVAWHPVHGEKLLADFELACARDLESARMLMRIGPMVGLMGTLIPMGPALVGLAAGDISAMALNMQVAFSTTVVGLFIGAIGFLTQQTKRRWFAGDANALEYIFTLKCREASS